MTLGEKMVVRRVLAEPLRIRALLALGRGTEAKDAVLALATSWLEPAVAFDSVNQVLTKGEVVHALESVAKAGFEADVAPLAEAMNEAKDEVFIPAGDDPW